MNAMVEQDDDLLDGFGEEELFNMYMLEDPGMQDLDFLESES